MSKAGKDKFRYKNDENLDSVFNYLSMLNKGLKNRHLSFGKDDDLVDMALPDDVTMAIEADTEDGEGSLKIHITWDNCKPDADEADKASRKAEKKRLKAEKEAAEKAEKEAKKRRKAEEKARKEDEKARKKLAGKEAAGAGKREKKAAMKKPTVSKKARVAGTAKSKAGTGTRAKTKA